MDPADKGEGEGDGAIGGPADPAAQRPSVIRRTLATARLAIGNGRTRKVGAADLRVSLTGEFYGRDFRRVCGPTISRQHPNRQVARTINLDRNSAPGKTCQSSSIASAQHWP
jgi:hypothetical protein